MDRHHANGVSEKKLIEEAIRVDAELQAVMEKLKSNKEYSKKSIKLLNETILDKEENVKV